MTRVTTHVLDTAAGSPAEGVPVTLQSLDPGTGWSKVDSGTTDADGRVNGFAPVEAGVHRLVFETRTPFFPEVAVTFNVAAEEHLHVPLLLSPFGYSVYRGS